MAGRNVKCWSCGEQCADYRKLPCVLALRCVYPPDLKSGSPADSHTP